MSLPDFDGDTFVAYVDISGFKEMSRTKALRAIDTFYSTGYRLTDSQAGDSSKVCGLFVSDCCVLFVNDSRTEPWCLRNSLRRLLEYIKTLNETMLRKEFMLISSVAYGNFTYRSRLVVSGIQKLPIYGHAYVNAFIDCDSGTPRISPGQCRILVENLPEDILEVIGEGATDPDFGLIQPNKGNKKHMYYHWMVSRQDELDTFRKRYRKAAEATYEAYLDTLKAFSLPCIKRSTKSLNPEL